MREPARERALIICHLAWRLHEDRHGDSPTSDYEFEMSVSRARHLYRLLAEMDAKIAEANRP